MAWSDAYFERLLFHSFFAAEIISESLSSQFICARPGIAITFRLYMKFAALAHTCSLVCLIYSIFLYYKELVKPYLLSVALYISYLFTKIDVIFDNIIPCFGIYDYLDNISYA